MTDTPIDSPYHAPTWRSRTAAARAGIGLGLSAAMTLGLVALAVANPSAGSLPGWIAIFGVLALLVWQSFLALCNALVTTATLRGEAGGVMITLGGRWPVRVDAADLDARERFEVVYGLGKPTKVKGPIIRPRRRPAQAWFVPVRRAAGRSKIALWAAARMYAGQRARMGFIVTPDHQNHKDLLTRLDGEAGRQVL